MLVFEGRGKPEYPEKKLSEQGREPATNSTHIWRRRRDLNPGHTGERQVLSPLHHPCSCLQEIAKPKQGAGHTNPKVTSLMRLVQTAKHKTRKNKNRQRGYGGADAWFVRSERPHKADGPGAVQCREEWRPKTRQQKFSIICKIHAIAKHSKVCYFFKRNH